MPHPRSRGGRREPAAYLRCYPSDRWQMQTHRHALDSYALRLGLSHPVVYLDNGRSATGALPALERLGNAVAAGVHHVVLVPGPWVFCLDPVVAHATVQRFAALGCEVVELPRDWSARPRGGGRPDHPPWGSGPRPAG
ncbi:hypothetical protein [Kitasatospora camelliae]|uniref:Resolvase-like protein n=1 Tax=Kitasatospora camelliae TaxID=3156397 RepID=A0AAU8K291_9ACTN